MVSVRSVNVRAKFGITSSRQLMVVRCQKMFVGINLIK